jgi:predicted transcriptional regulator
MDDQKNGVEQTPAAESNSVESRANSEVETKVDQTNVESQQTAENSTPEKKEEQVNNSEDGNKPTRYERRVQKLIGKLKEKDQNQTNGVAPDINEILGLNPNQPLINPNEIADGGIDPVELERRQQAREMSLRQSIKNEIAAETQFKDTIKDHLADADKTAELLKGDDAMDETVAEQYKLANYQVNPFTGKEEFVPRVKMSDIYAKQKKLLDAQIAKATANVSGKLSQTGQESAIRPSSQGDKTGNEEFNSSFEAAKESGTTESWAEHLKKLL